MRGLSLLVGSTCAVLVIAWIPSPVAAQQSVFEGLPDRRVVTTSFDSVEEDIEADAQHEFKVQIVEVERRYYWASREMKELRRSEGGASVTFHAIDGSGYVRVLANALPRSGFQPTSDVASSGHAYVEHLLLALGSITYFGRAN